MLSLYRGLSAGMLIVGLVALGGDPARAQDKKKDPKAAKPEDIKDRLVGISTSDGLVLNAYWFKGVALEKQRPDAVIMMPAPGHKINDAWISLAKSLSEKNFSVLLFDWRGCGLNGPAGVGSGSRIIDEKEKFWNEAYNYKILSKNRTVIEKQGLDFNRLKDAADSRGRYRDFMFMNDLLAARFYLDKMNDAGSCNTNRVWIVSEKEGAHLGLAFIAAEFQRNSVFDPKKNAFDTEVGFKSAGRDYVGLVALSFTASGPMSNVASMIYRNALPSIGANNLVKDGMNHLQTRLAMVLICSKKESTGNSMGVIRLVKAEGTEEQMKTRYKYVKEFDIKVAKPISGIDMIDPMDSFGVEKYIRNAMVEISIKQPGSRDPNDRDAAKLTYVPRFNIEKFNKR